MTFRRLQLISWRKGLFWAHVFKDVASVRLILTWLIAVSNRSRNTTVVLVGSDGVFFISWKELRLLRLSVRRPFVHPWLVRALDRYNKAGKVKPSSYAAVHVLFLLSAAADDQ